MDTGEWEQEFTEARRQLLESRDLHVLRNRGHDLKNGAVLTSVSEVPFEVSLKCVRCGATFWFENAAWSTGGVKPWQISGISLEQARVPCSAAGRAIS